MTAAQPTGFEGLFQAGLEQSVDPSALLKHLAMASPDIMTVTEAESGRYVMVNPTFERITGHRAVDALGRTAMELGIWLNAEERQALFAALGEKEQLVNHVGRFLTRSGRHVALLMSVSRFRMAGKVYLVIVGRDVTQSEKTRMLHQAIVDNASIGIAVSRGDYFTMVNPQFELTMGWPVGSLTGQPGAMVWNNAEDFEAFKLAVTEPLLAGETVELEIPMLRRDETEFQCRFIAKSIVSGGLSGGTIWLIEDVTERLQLGRALAQARDAAEAANRAKSTFLANTSHEIRTPLNALIGLARLARQPGIDDLRKRGYIERISESAEALSAIIADILDLSKVEAGALHTECLPFRLAPVLDSVTQAYGTLAGTQGLTLVIDAERGLPERVEGDAGRLRQILSNFLSNSLKFTARGHIILHVRRWAGEQLRFEVIDTGIGLSEDAQARLFTPFTQIENEFGRATGGTGLGLSICRELAHLMGGEVGVESTPGEGSCFWLVLPLPESTEAEFASSSGTGGLDPLEGSRLLLVEDNPVNMMISLALLEQWGAEVVQANDGLDAVAKVEDAFVAGRPFDLVLMDVQMPRLDGVAATQRLRKHYSPVQLPIVALTAAALVSERDRALAGGMNDFLTKPIDPSLLRRSLVRWLRPEGGLTGP
jgi:PAS domain S-box-containing protein